MHSKPVLYALLALIVLFVIIRVLRSTQTINSAEGQAVILKLRLASGQMGNDAERQAIHELEDRLSDTIKRSAVGEFDGDEYGDGYCTIYMYGPNAEALFNAIKPALKGYQAHSGSYAVKRFGKPGSKQDRIPLSGE